MEVRLDALVKDWGSPKFLLLDPFRNRASKVNRSGTETGLRSGESGYRYEQKA
jgi:hypothetical protein